MGFDRDEELCGWVAKNIRLTIHDLSLLATDTEAGLLMRRDRMGRDRMSRLTLMTPFPPLSSPKIPPLGVKNSR